MSHDLNTTARCSGNARGHARDDREEGINLYDSNSMQHNKHALFETVSTATHVSDFNGMLNLVPLDKLKQFLNEHIDGLESTSARNFFLLSASINRVFHDDLLQHIVSFEHVDRTKSVCETWRTLSNKNERRNYLKLCDEAQKVSPLQFNDQTNLTWIVHPARTKLNSTERELGYQGPISCIHSAVAHNCESGVYTPPCIQFERSVEIIGIGSNVTILDEDEDDGYGNDPDAFLSVGRERRRSHSFATPREVFLMNINLDYTEECTHTDCAVYIGRGHRLSTHKCTLKAPDIGITVRPDACFKATECQFSAGTAIEISPLAAMVTVNISLFRYCGYDDQTDNGGHFYGCVSIYDKYRDLQAWKREHGEDTEYNTFVSLQCDGNTFEENICYPIAERGRRRNTDLKPSLTNNLLKGYNATEIDAANLEEANTLYFNDERYSAY